MKLTTPEIVWHNKQPLLSADFHCGESSLRLATGGADNDVKVWKISKDEGGEKLKIVFMSSLSRHTKAVNVVRFSPNGEFLASAGDDAVIHIWRRDKTTSGATDGNLVSASGDSSPSKNKENWTVLKLLRGHLEDIYDLCWSPDSQHLISGSVDNSAIVWDVQKGQQMAILKESKQYIQGVAWDPCGEYVITLSTDRNMRVYSVDQKFKCVHTVNKLSLGDSKHTRLWVDEVNSFFRRLTFTPDGSFLIAPAGRFELEEKVLNASYVFARSNLSKPVLQLPGADKPSVVVRCCPALFELMEEPADSTTTLTSLSYRMVYAVASLDSVFLYDTQHTAPFAYISKIHYSGITDLAWSENGLTLVITSSDCYCTIVTFEPNELGKTLPRDKFPSTMLTQSSTSPTSNHPSPPEPQSKRPKGNSPSSSTQDTPSSTVQAPESSPPVADSTSVGASKPRRIRPTLISNITSPNGKVDTSAPLSPSQPLRSPVSNDTSASTVVTHPAQSVTAAESSTTDIPMDCSSQDDITSTGDKQKSNGSFTKLNGSATSNGSVLNTRPPSEGQGPRRVNFTTLSTFSTSLSTKTPTKVAGSTSSGGGTDEDPNCIVIE